MARSTTTNELVITRIFDAPRELVYRAFTDPDRLAEWFGPVGYSVPRETIEVDVRPGGHQRFVMVSDDDPALTSPVTAQFTEVVENELLAGVEDVEGVAGEPGRIRLHLRIEFHAENGKTRLDLRQGPFTEQTTEMARTGWHSSFTKLDALLAG